MTRKDLLMETNPTPLQTLQEHIHSLAPVLGWLREHPALDDARVAWSTRDHISLYIDGYSDDSPERFANAVRALKDGASVGTIRREDDENHTRFERNFGAITVGVYTTRATVCERVVVGTETVEVPDPDAPKVTVERDKVEWRCRPILAGDQAKVEVPA